jgi:hypothetical protein
MRQHVLVVTGSAGNRDDIIVIVVLHLSTIILPQSALDEGFQVERFQLQVQDITEDPHLRFAGRVSTLLTTIYARFSNVAGDAVARSQDKPS